MVIVVRPAEIALMFCRIARSVGPSSIEVASSNTYTSGSFRIARAIAIRWRSPPESLSPRSPMAVR